MSDTIPNSFDAVLRQQRKGKLLAELSEKLQEAVRAVNEHVQTASLTLTLKIEPAGGDEYAMSVADEVKVKLPQPRKPKSLFYATDDGCLVRENPHQKELSFTVAEDESKTEPPALPAASA